MKAAVRDRFGSPSAVVEIRELEKPVPGEGEVLVRVHAASLNFGDWYAVEGRPWVGRPSMGLRTPKSERLGTDYAGVVEAVGANVTGFQPGDAVFGGRSGSLAEYVAARADRSIVHKPANVTFEDAAAVPVAAITALQGLRDHGHVAPGQKVLVNGASGGVGTYAGRPKALGAEVTASSPANVETAQSCRPRRRLHAG
jgi:NADPH:quinone reductase-like Zn-dependent oxidoreductase